MYILSIGPLSTAIIEQNFDLSFGLFNGNYLLSSQIEKINGFGFDFATFAEVFENDAGWVISEKKSFKFHFWIFTISNYRKLNIKVSSSRNWRKDCI